MASSDSLAVFGNRHSLSMLFDNLISNAAKYSFESGKIYIDFEEKKDAFLFQIKDDGYGIEKSELKKIFNKFYRVDSISKKRVDGSGLGLFVCRAIVKSHGGKIYATSQGPDKGAVFYVELKRLDTHC
jgi:signal transduction histidine kinase